MEPQALSLGRDVSTRCECIVKELKVRLLEERLGRSDGVRRIGDDDIVGGFVLCEKLESVANINGHPWRSEEARHVW
jgi:hypothetical protein